MEPHSHLLLTLLATSSFLLANCARVPDLDPSITKATHDICTITIYKVTCISAACVFAKEHNLVISNDTMMEMHIRLGISRTRTAKATAERLKRAAAAVGGPKAAAGLETCIAMYGNMLADLDTALASLKSKDQGTTMTNLSAMFPNIWMCDDDFNASKLKNPLARRNKILRRISSNALAIGWSKWNIVV